MKVVKIGAQVVATAKISLACDARMSWSKPRGTTSQVNLTVARLTAGAANSIAAEFGTHCFDSIYFHGFSFFNQAFVGAAADPR